MKLLKAFCISSCMAYPTRLPDGSAVPRAVLEAADVVLPPAPVDMEVLAAQPTNLVKKGLKHYHSHPHDHPHKQAGDDHDHPHEHSEDHTGHNDHDHPFIPVKSSPAHIREAAAEAAKAFQAAQASKPIVAEPVASEPVSTEPVTADVPVKAVGLAAIPSSVPKGAVENDHHAPAKLLEQGLIHFHSHPHESNGKIHDHPHEHSQVAKGHNDVELLKEKKTLTPAKFGPIALLTHEEAVNLIMDGKRLVHDHPHTHEGMNGVEHTHAHEHSQKVLNHEDHPHLPEVPPTDLLPAKAPPSKTTSRKPGGAESLPRVLPSSHKTSRTPTSGGTVISKGHVLPALTPPLPKESVAKDKYSFFVPREILLGERSHWKENGHLVHIPSHKPVPWPSVNAKTIFHD